VLARSSAKAGDHLGSKYFRKNQDGVNL